MGMWRGGNVASEKTLGMGVEENSHEKWLDCVKKNMAN